MEYLTLVPKLLYFRCNIVDQTDFKGNKEIDIYDQHLWAI